MTITGISQNLHHIQGAFQQDRASQLSESQKEVWKDFLMENKSTVDLGGEDRASELTFLTSNTPWNLFSFNTCRCDSVAQDMNAATFGESAEEDPLPEVENDLMATGPTNTDEGYHTTEKTMPELILDASLDSNSQALAAGLFENLDSTIQNEERTGAESDIIVESPTENIINYAKEHLSDDSPMTFDWLSKHLGVTRLISAFPEFASYLNENSDLAVNFMKSLEEVKATLENFFTENAVEKASEFLSDDSPITDEWLAENISAAHFIARHGNFATYLNENVEQAEKFISLLA
jgi:hypothetical protein